MKKRPKKYVKNAAKPLMSPLLWLTLAFLVFISVMTDITWQPSVCITIPSANLAFILYIHSQNKWDINEFKCLQHFDNSPDFEGLT
jgi:hypothetical protein